MDGTGSTPHETPAPEGGFNLFTSLMLLASLALAGYVLSPLLHAIAFAAVLAHLTTPVKDRFERRFPGRPSLAAALVVGGTVIVVIVPLLLLLWALVAEGATAMTGVQKWLSEGGVRLLLQRPKLLEVVDWVTTRLPFGSELDLSQQLSAISKKAAETLVGQGAAFATNTAYLIAQLFMMFFILFYLLRDGRAILERVAALTPMRRADAALILARVGETSKSVFVGTFLTAAAQGVAGGVGLLLAGLPGFFWGAMMAAASLIPVVGTALVWIPAVLYLLITGNYLAALFLAGWCVLIVGTIDNFLRPFLMRGKGGLPPLFIFLAVVGGLSVFGLSGILFGPLILTFASGMIDLYQHSHATEERS